MIDVGGVRDQHALVLLRARDPLVQRYRAFFAHLDWLVVPARDATRAWPGPPPQPTTAFVQVLLIKLCEHKEYVTQVRRFLVDHPLLVLKSDFRVINVNVRALPRARVLNALPAPPASALVLFKPTLHP